MALNDIYELGRNERKTPKPIDPNALGLKPVMKIKDWIMLGVLIVVVGGLWAWVWSEYKKPIIAEHSSLELSSEDAS